MKNKLLKAKETLIENVLKKIDAGDASIELYNIIKTEIAEIQYNENYGKFKKNVLKIVNKGM